MCAAPSITASLGSAALSDIRRGRENAHQEVVCVYDPSHDRLMDSVVMDSSAYAETQKLVQVENTTLFFN